MQVTEKDDNYLRFRIDVHANGYMAVSETNGMVTFVVSVYNEDLEIVFSSEAPYSISRWSADGNLAYCRGNNLFVWDGQDSIYLSRITFYNWLMTQSYSRICSVG